MTRGDITRTDLVIATLFFVVAAFIGTSYVRGFVRGGGRQMFYQSYFEPAVLWTCGHGFVRSVSGPGPAVAAFLRTERDSITCADLTPGAVTTDGLYQRAWLYLMLSVGATWRLTGISWAALAPLFGVLFALTVATAYALFRLSMGRVIAAAAAAALMVSTLHLTNLPHLRDYAKAPFVLLLVVIIWVLVTRTLSTRAVIVCAALYGAILGVGYGFRSDLLANVPPFVLALAFLPGGWRSNAAAKLAALTAAAGVFFVVAAPVNQQVARTGSCLGHVTLLGFSAPFTDALGVRPARYDLGIVFNDEVLDAQVTGYANRRAQGTGALEYCAPEYDRVTAAYLADIGRVFPADLVVRAYGSTRQILNVAFKWIDPPTGASMTQLAFRARAFVLKRVDGLGTWLAAAALVIVSTASLRIALFALLMLLYFGGYPAAQFAPRHYFHLEFVDWLIVGFLLHRVIEAARRRQFSFAWRPAAAFAAIAAAIVYLLLAGARAYQHDSVAALLTPYESASGEDIASSAAHGGEWSLAVPPIDERGRVLRLQLTSAPPCEVGAVLAIEYGDGHSAMSWTRAVRVASGQMPAMLLVPLEQVARAVRLSGLSCARVERATLVEPNPGAPLLPHATLSARWRDERDGLHQTLQ